jgi:hypothetical protein
VRKATAAEHRQRVDYTLAMLVKGHRKSFIKDFFRKNYGVGARQVERYLRLARDRLVQSTERDRAELVAESFAFYMSVMQGAEGETSVRDKLQARKQADDLLGLAAPTKIATTTVAGQDLYAGVVQELSNEELDVLERIAQRHAALLTGDGAGGTA